MLTRATGTARRSERCSWRGTSVHHHPRPVSRHGPPARPVDGRALLPGRRRPDGMVLCASGPRASCDSGRPSACAQTPVCGHQRQACTIRSCLVIGACTRALRRIPLPLKPAQPQEASPRQHPLRVLGMAIAKRLLPVVGMHERGHYHTAISTLSDSGRRNSAENRVRSIYRCL
jgi:hypothetical protein